ncbi:MAG: Do family serine endopeptidase [Hyphomicrobiales bacterium]|nr:Do family serine endopeptidase [Hyphomicrobiales bacterium]
MSFDRPSYSLRAALLGAVALAALGGFAAETSVAPVSAAATTAQAPAGPASFADVVDRVKPAVVSVKVKLSDADQVDDEDGDSDGIPGLQDIPKNSPFYRFFRHFGMPNNNEGQDHGDRAPHHHFTQAQGSGFFISGDGYIVTNNHVVDHASEVTVTTSEGKSMPAKVIGVDSKTDLALLKAEGSDFPHVTFAEHTPRVGDWVIAVCNPFGLGGTVTAGIVSARGRDIGSGPYDDFLQIDAPVNHGNSGGPTFNAEGEVVGVNTAIFSPSGGSVGIGFAIASDVVQNVVQQLKDTGSVTRGWIGVQIQNVTADLADDLGIKGTTGALVAAAQKDSPAAAAGVKSGDVITAVDGETVADPHDLARRIAALGPKKTVKLSLVRNGSPMTIDVTLGTMPADKTASAETRNSDDAGGSALAKLGLTLRPAHGQDGVVVADVDPDGAAADKGLKQGDVILEVAGKSVNRPAEVAQAIDTAKSDGKKSVLVRVKSNDGEHYLTLPTRAS